MGLDFNYGAAHWSYIGFMRFRVRIADQVGLKDFIDITETSDPRFDALGKDPIRLLLAHSDCDGWLTPTDCKKLAPRLREIIKDWEFCHDKTNGTLLARAMDEAAKKKKNLKFQ